MCFDVDSSPPIRPVSGASVGHRQLEFEAEDGNRFAAYEAFTDSPGDAAVVVLPDVRGLFAFYQELAERLAEVGYDAVAIDYFGRTAGVAVRDGEFPFMDHIPLTTAAGVRADVAAAVAYLRRDDPDRRVFTVGFCFGGSNSWHQAANGHGLSGVIGFYGNPVRELPVGAGCVIDRVAEMACPVLGLMGGDDPGIPAEAIQAFDQALTAAGVKHEVITYPGAPHSFFDRKQSEFAAESADAWRRLLEFIQTRTG
jgi:carboxymethylenebutenolidase